MPADLREVMVDVLRNMHFEVDSLTDETPLGDGGLELESLSLAELVMQLDEFGIEFTDDEMEELSKMTFGEFAEEAARRTTAK
ncbi:acyl carrier protein [Yinghuangia soli]|uniref:Acyl carrier protein n=1 Tax=Yinghuangia soli TaxID=2908204 RepID=A0AA41U2N3_9ACTN|nr:acyl carrier protein [Yinghuangia soli]MCF2528827.1 acyl carrier protein [Yinghuangia soli]